MATRIGINGFGRMGRLALRAGWGRPDLEFVHINEVAGGAETAAHLLTFDSVHGRWDRPCRGRRRSDRDRRDDRRVFGRARRPATCRGRRTSVDIVLECSGKFRTTDTLDPYFAAGVQEGDRRRAGQAGALNIVMGVNDHLYDPAHAPPADRGVLHDQLPGAGRQGDSRGDRHQPRRDHDDPRHHQHPGRRRCAAQGSAARRASSLSLIPTSTGSATAIGLIYPELLGKLTGIAVRVPLLNASLTDCVFEVQRPTTVEEVNAAFKARGGRTARAAFSATKSGRWSRSTTRTIRARPSSMRCRRWSSTARASRCWRGTTTRSATSTA